MSLTLKLLSEQKAADRMSVQSSWQSNYDKKLMSATHWWGLSLKAMTAPYPELADDGAAKVMSSLGTL